ncbi:MAG: DUF3090 domain-containing protein [Anaerolineales bacterium]|jgi:uncharacterized repeat protein (TIGR03847 family)
MDENESIEIDLNPVTHITTDAIGPPGQRVFYIQGQKDDQVVCLIIEKFQLQTLTIGVEQFLAEVRQRMPDLEEAPISFSEEEMHIQPPVEPLFRVAEFGLSYDSEKDLIALIAREIPSQAEEEGQVVRYWCTRAQIRAMIHWGLEITSRGRPLCPQCGQPMDPEGHFCSRKNGHKH